MIIEYEMNLKNKTKEELIILLEEANKKIKFQDEIIEAIIKNQQYDTRSTEERKIDQERKD